MKRASEFFADEEKKRIEEAVAEAEKETAGEIVPVVATQSGRYDRAEDIFGLLLGLLVVAVAWPVWQGVTELAGSWNDEPSLQMGLLPVLLLFLGGFVAGAALATHIRLLARPFIPKSMMLAEIRQRAAEAFFKFRVRGTEGGTGILIYISLFERMVWVVGDDPITERLDQAHWDEIKEKIVEGIREGKAADGLCAGITRCGELLAEHFPIQPGDVNELTNELRILD